VISIKFLIYFSYYYFVRE